jgi:hypothetical protein
MKGPLDRPFRDFPVPGSKRSVNLTLIHVSRNNSPSFHLPRNRVRR